VDKALKILALAWTALILIANIIVVGGALLRVRSFLVGPAPFAIILLFVLFLFLVDAVLLMPALAAEWFRSMMIAKTRFAVLSKRRLS
jgi:hypothetical protein